MDRLSQRRLKFLNDTISFYNINNRGIKPVLGFDMCQYYVDEHTRCAIGRHLTKKLAIKLDKTMSPGVATNKTFKLLSKNLKSLGQDFLSDIQNLHDVRKNWTIRGLSKEGRLQVNIIKREFNLNQK